jgi:hypothetical protein
MNDKNGGLQYTARHGVDKVFTNKACKKLPGENDEEKGVGVEESIMNESFKNNTAILTLVETCRISIDMDGLVKNVPVFIFKETTPRVK